MMHISGPLAEVMGQIVLKQSPWRIGAMAWRAGGGIARQKPQDRGENIAPPFDHGCNSYALYMPWAFAEGAVRAAWIDGRLLNHVGARNVKA